MDAHNVTSVVRGCNRKFSARSALSTVLCSILKMSALLVIATISLIRLLPAGLIVAPIGQETIY